MTDRRATVISEQNQKTQGPYSSPKQLLPKSLRSSFSVSVSKYLDNLVVHILIFKYFQFLFQYIFSKAKKKKRDPFVCFSYKEWDFKRIFFFNASTQVSIFLPIGFQEEV